MTTTHASSELSRVTEERADLERLVKGPNAYRTISEVADELHVPQHVLRFWETRFPEVKPLKRGGGRRYYSPEDVDLLRHITDLLYVQGYTIKGVQRVLKATESDAVVAEPSVVVEDEEIHPVPVGNGAGIREASQGMDERPTPDNDSQERPIQEMRPSFEIPVFHDTDRQDEAVLPSGGAAIESASDPGEETVSPDVVSPDESGLAAAHEDASTEVPSTASSDSVIAAVLFDELLELRTRQANWRQERKTLRLALEDVLGELDNLRQMVPSEI